MVRGAARLRLPATLAISLIIIALAVLTLSPRAGLANWSGQNGKISFLTQEQNSDGDIEAGVGTMDPDGSHRRLLFTIEVGDEFLFPASWSPDGTKLLGVTGGNLVEVLTFDGNGDFARSTVIRAIDPSWVPDNQHIIASMDADLYILDLQGHVVQNLTNTVGVDERDSALSRDLSTIVYSSNEDPDENPALPPVAGPFYNLWEMNANGTGRHVLYRADKASIMDFHPDWKPDLSSIAFWDGNDLWTIAPNGTNATQLTNSVLLEAVPTWSPDGKLILYNQAPDATLIKAQIWTIDPVTKARKRVTPDPDNQVDFAPGWQPIGNASAPNFYVWGANTCGPRPTALDVLAALKKLAGITLPTVPSCPPMGQAGITSGGVEGHWGDTDCSGTITIDDVFLLFQYILEMGPFASGGVVVPINCVAIDTYLQWIPTT